MKKKKQLQHQQQEHIWKGKIIIMNIKISENKKKKNKKIAQQRQQQTTAALEWVPNSDNI